MVGNRDYTPGTPTTEVSRVIVPSLITGNLAYSLFLWLMKPYMGHLDCRKEHLNYCLSRCCLKVYWRALSMLLNKVKDYSPLFYASTCILYKILRSRRKFSMRCLQRRHGAPTNCGGRTGLVGQPQHPLTRMYMPGTSQPAES